MVLNLDIVSGFFYDHDDSSEDGADAKSIGKPYDTCRLIFPEPPVGHGVFNLFKLLKNNCYFIWKSHLLFRYLYSKPKQTDMKTLGIDHGDIIRLSIDENGQITHSSWEHSKTSVDEVQKMVDKLIRLKMITLGKEEIMVSVCIWGIDETDDYYIETFHGEDDLSDDDVTMKYTEFLNTK